MHVYVVGIFVYKYTDRQSSGWSLDPKSDPSETQ